MSSANLEINPMSRKSAVIDGKHLKELKELGVEELSDWLAESGYSDYKEKFQDHRIDGECVPLLTNNDLEAIGIDKVGDRVKLMKDLREFRVAVEIEHRTKPLLKWKEFRWMCSPFDQVRDGTAIATPLPQYHCHSPRTQSPQFAGGCYVSLPSCHHCP